MRKHDSAQEPRVTSSSALRTVSHTLDTRLADRLRYFAFEQRVSESAVLEHALTLFFRTGSDQEVATVLREAGYRLRRRTA